MCMEDVKINRATKTNVYTTAGTINIPANPRRLSLRLTYAAADPLSLPNNMATLFATSWPIKNFALSTFPLLNIMQFAAAGAADAITAPIFKNEDYVDIEMIGQAIWSSLQLSATAGANAYLTETYLDVDQVPPIDAGHR